MKKTQHKILFISSSAGDRNAFKRYFKKLASSYDHATARSLAEARGLLGSGHFDVIVCEHPLDDGTAEDIIALKPGVPVIAVAKKGNVRAALSLVKGGAADYIVKGRDFSYLKELHGIIDESISSGKGAGPGPDTTVYQQIVDATNMLIWRTDAEGRFTFVNPAWERILSYRAEEMLGKPLSDFQMPNASEYYINAFRNCLIGEQVIGHETVFHSKQGDEIHVVINTIPISDSSGTIIGTQGIAHDITERKHADELLQYISAKDELTGLYNLHTFISMTEQQIKTANREKKEILIIYTGIDGMRSINEDLGYHTGDQVLVDTANILKKTFREADIIARTGGDEFVISTIISARDDWKLIMNRLKKNIDAYNSGNSGSPKVKFSFGTSFYNPEHPVSIEDLLSHADERMHEDKESGKSR